MTIRRLCCARALVIAAVMLSSSTTPTTGGQDSQPQLPSLYTGRLSRMPLSFTRNDGQWDPQVLFRTQWGEMTVWCTGSGLWYCTEQPIEVEGGPASPESLIDPRGIEPGDRAAHHITAEGLAIHSRFIDANPDAVIAGQEQSDYRCNYFIGNNSAAWRTDVPSFARITYEDLYPGIDLAIYGNAGAVEYDFIVHPDGDASAIAMSFDGVQSTLVDRDGNLVLVTPWGELLQRLPQLYELLPDGQRRTVSGAFCVSESGLVQFDIPESRNPGFALVIDPVLLYSTYLGGGDWDDPKGIAVDADGSAYITGFTRSADFPTQDPYDADFNGEEYDVFVTKLSPAGNSLVYSTYIGGTGYGQYGYGIDVDGLGAAYVVGQTFSSDFPMQNAYDAGYNGEWDAFALKLAPAGNALLYSTFLGGSSDDGANSVAVDAGGRACIVGWTSSPNFPLASAYDGSHNGSVDVFVTRLAPVGNTLEFSTFLGGGAQDWGYGVALDTAGNSYIVGITSSSNWPTQNAYDGSFNGGDTDGLVASLRADGAVLRYSTYLGGSSDDYATCICADVNGMAGVTGYTTSSDFPVQNPFDGSHNGSDDLFVSWLTTGGDTLRFSTFLGGTGQEFGQGNCIVQDSKGCLIVVGRTTSTVFPTLHAFDSTFNGGGYDAFLSRLDPIAGELVYSSFLGGSGLDEADGVAIDGSGLAIVTGFTESIDFPVESPYDASFSGGTDVFVTKLPVGPLRGLVGHWSMNDQAGATIIDSSGNDFTGTASGTTVATGVRGNARRFDGVDDRIEIPSDILMSINDSITIAFWIRPDGDFSEGYVLSKGLDGFGVNYAVRVVCRTGLDSVEFNAGPAGEMRIVAGAGLDGGRWHHLGFSLNLDDVNSGQWVLDGQPVTTTSICGADVNPAINTSFLHIGGQLGTTSRYFKGNIDEVRLYDRTLPAGEIGTLYQSTRWDHVSSLADAGPGTLRNAIDVANLSPGVDTIAFSVAGVINLTTPLPSLSDFTGLTAIRGFTAPEAFVPYSPTLILDGSGCVSGPGLVVTASGGNLIEGLEIRHFPDQGVLLNSVFSRCTIRQNRIHSNGLIGIDLGGTGVTPNDPGDVDAGPNTLLNYPEIDTIYLIGQDSFYVAGTATPNSTIELFLAGQYLGGDTLTDASGFGEGWLFLDSARAHETTGHFAFPVVESRAWSWVTATTTDTLGNTSEFSHNRQLIPDSLVFTTYSPVTITVIEPDSSDSIGPGFNTIGPTAVYDSLTDYGIGPSGIPAETDDRVIITNVQPGEYIVRVKPDPGADGDGYFFGIRVDGTNEAYQSVSGVMSPTPVTNQVPDAGEEHVYAFTPSPQSRGDLDGNGYLDAVDLAVLIDIVFFGSPSPNPPELADINCDGFPDAVDLAVLIDHVFFGGPPPC